MKPFVFFFFWACTQMCLCGFTSAPQGTSEDTPWMVEERSGRPFYFTHGTAVWGHEFGLYKTRDCAGDIVWLSLSARDEKIKDYDGKEVSISLDVDDRVFEIQSTMHYMGVIGYSHVMYFYDWVAGPLLMDAFMKGQKVTVSILRPEEFVALVDVPADVFSLEGLPESRRRAASLCGK